VSLCFKPTCLLGLVEVVHLFPRAVFTCYFNWSVNKIISRGSNLKLSLCGFKKIN